MKEKKISYVWAILIGLLMPVLQMVIFYLRFGEVNLDDSLFDYMIFFLAGTLGGLILVSFLRLSKSKAAKWSVSLAFILATPMAIIGMIVGGMIGPLGSLFMSAMLWAVITSMGYFVGRFLSRNV